MITNGSSILRLTVDSCKDAFTVSSIEFNCPYMFLECLQANLLPYPSYYVRYI